MFNFVHYLMALIMTILNIRGEKIKKVEIYQYNVYYSLNQKRKKYVQIYTNYSKIYNGGL
jgi:hypothetical protein